MEGHEHAILTCDSCGKEAEHTLIYAGHILVSSTCSACGFTRHHSDTALRKNYAHDLQSRVTHKPSEMYRRFRRHPFETAAALPFAIVRLPFKLTRELITVIRN